MSSPLLLQRTNSGLTAHCHTTLRAYCRVWDSFTSGWLVQCQGSTVIGFTLQLLLCRVLGSSACGDKGTAGA
jgi:hypothetical protein